MNKIKAGIKTKIILSLTLLFVMFFCLIDKPLVSYAATNQKNYAGYNTKTGEVSYYDILSEDSNGIYYSNRDNGDSDSHYSSSKN